MTGRNGLKLATRGSKLALWQAHAVAERLQAAGVSCDIVVIRTSGDQRPDVRGPEGDTKRQFVKELEDALIRGDVDLAVHSAKDMPVVLPDGLAIAACLPRADPRDAIVLPQGGPTGDLATNPRAPQRRFDDRHRQRQAYRPAGIGRSARQIRADPRQRGHEARQAG